MSRPIYYRDGKLKCFLATSLDEAHSLGYFGRSMHRDTLMELITRYNPELRWIANADYRGLFDTSKGYVCGIPHFSTIPQHSIMEYNFAQDRVLEYTNMYGEITGREKVNQDEVEFTVLARGWETIFAILEEKGYKVDRRLL